MSTNPNASADQIIACNPSAIDAVERDSHFAISQEIFSAATILEIKELADGYGFRLPLDTPMIHKIAQFIANDRLCCSFFTYRLVVNDQLWIELTGTPEVKALIQVDVLTMIQTGDFPTMDELQATYDTVTGTLPGA